MHSCGQQFAAMRRPIGKADVEILTSRCLTGRVRPGAHLEWIRRGTNATIADAAGNGQHSLGG